MTLGRWETLAAYGVTLDAAWAKHFPPTVTVSSVLAGVSVAVAKKCVAFIYSWNRPGDFLMPFSCSF